jgi:hypothetical protein
MMNKATRRLSKMPDEVRGEIAPWFIDRHAIEEEATEKIIKLDSNAKYVDSDLKVSSAFFLFTSLATGTCLALITKDVIISEWSITSSAFFIHFTRYRNLSCINKKRCYY